MCSEVLFYSSELVNDKIVITLNVPTERVSHLISEGYKLVGQFTCEWVRADHVCQLNINLTFENGSTDPDLQCNDPTF